MGQYAAGDRERRGGKDSQIYVGTAWPIIHHDDDLIHLPHRQYPLLDLASWPLGRATSDKTKINIGVARLAGRTTEH